VFIIEPLLLIRLIRADTYRYRPEISKLGEGVPDSAGLGGAAGGIGLGIEVKQKLLTLEIRQLYPIACWSIRLKPGALLPDLSLAIFSSQLKTNSFRCRLGYLYSTIRSSK
jgi:hypothetical protein